MQIIIDRVVSVLLLVKEAMAVMAVMVAMEVKVAQVAAEEEEVVVVVVAVAWQSHLLQFEQEESLIFLFVVLLFVM